MEVRQELPGMAPEGSRFNPPYSTSSVCACHSGTTHNVIPSKAEVEWEMRVVQRTDREWLRGQMGRYVDEVLRPEMKKVSPAADIFETVCIETVESGKMTKDLAVLIHGSQLDSSHYLTTQQFLSALKENLEAKIN